jgi:hypothetical protein
MIFKMQHEDEAKTITSLIKQSASVGAVDELLPLSLRQQVKPQADAQRSNYYYHIITSET